MPPQRKKWVHKKHEHCLIWTGRDGIFVIRCAHCDHVQAQIDVSLTYSEEEIEAAAKASRSAHAKNKHAPVKDPCAVAIRRHFSPERIAQVSYNPMAR